MNSTEIEQHKNEQAQKNLQGGCISRMWVELHLEGELQAVHAGGVTAALPWRQKQHESVTAGGKGTPFIW